MSCQERKRTRFFLRQWFRDSFEGFNMTGFKELEEHLNYKKCFSSIYLFWCLYYLPLYSSSEAMLCNFESISARYRQKWVKFVREEASFDSTWEQLPCIMHEGQMCAAVVTLRLRATLNMSKPINLGVRISFGTLPSPLFSKPSHKIYIV